MGPMAVLIIALGSPLVSDLRATEEDPLFAGSTVVLHGIEYAWDSATEDSTWHVDVYHPTTPGQGSVTVTFRGKVEGGLAEVKGYDPFAAFSGVNGFWQSGFGDCSVSGSEDGEFWPWPLYTHFTHHEFTGVYEVRFDTQDGDVIAQVSGGEYYSNTTIYGTQGLNTSTNEDGSGSYSWNAFDNGGYEYGESVSWDSSGYFTGANYGIEAWAGDASEWDLFGTAYAFAGGTHSWSSEWTSSGGGLGTVDTWAEHFQASDDSYADITYESYDAINHTTVSGWDYYLGEFSDNGTGLMWANRVVPAFAATQIGVEGTYFSWTGGSLDSDGVVTDTYSGTLNDAGCTIEIKGSPRQVATADGSAQVTMDGNPVPIATFTQADGFDSLFIQNGSANQSTPYFCPSATLWVNGSEFPFFGGWEDSVGRQSDVYSNTSAGFVILSRGPESEGVPTVNVTVSFNGFFTGSYLEGVFAMSPQGIVILTQPLPFDLPPAFWVAGRFYVQKGTPGATTEYESRGGQGTTPDGKGSLILSAASGSYDIAGEDFERQWVIAGSFEGGNGAFWVTCNDTYPALACAANADTAGTLPLSAIDPPAGCPPALQPHGLPILTLVGKFGDGAACAAWYINVKTARSEEDNNVAMSIKADGTVSLINYQTGAVSGGTYLNSVHVFSTGVNASLPMPVYPVAPPQYPVWGLVRPPDGLGLPDTFIVHGQVWRFVRMNGDTPVYSGYYTGQTLSLGTANSLTGVRMVTINDPVNGAATGLLSNTRGSVHLSDGSVAYSGYETGARLNPTLQQNNITTISGDLDITGNILTMGALTNDAAIAGLTTQFWDIPQSGQAAVAFALGRPLAEWTWYHAGETGTDPAVPMMKLDQASRLSLFDPASPSQGAIELNPSGTSIFSGAVSIGGNLLIQPQGDLLMGGFTSGPHP